MQGGAIQHPDDGSAAASGRTMGKPAPPRLRDMPVSLKHIGNVNDYDVADALNAFARRVAGEAVTVDFTAGAATLSGRVASDQARRALEDLIAAHEGVESVVNDLVVAPEAARTPSG
jgi:hypothetical protein